MDSSVDVWELIKLIVAVLAVAIAWLSYRMYHLHQKKRYTLEMMHEWDSITLKSRSAVNRVRDIYDKSMPDPLPFSEIIRYRQAQLEGRQDERGDILITDHIICMLNYMNWVAIAVRMDIVIREEVVRDLAPAFERWWNFLSEFRAHYGDTGIRIRYPWPELDNLISEYKKKRGDYL